MRKLPPPARKSRRLKRYCDRLGVSVSELPPLINVEDFVIEEEHAGGRNHNRDLVAPVTRNANGELEKRRKAAEVNMRYQKDPIRRMIETSKAEAIFLELQAESKMKQATELEKYLQRRKKS